MGETQAISCLVRLVLLLLARITLRGPTSVFLGAGIVKVQADENQRHRHIHVWSQRLVEVQEFADSRRDDATNNTENFTHGTCVLGNLADKDPAWRVSEQGDQDVKRHALQV